MALAQRHHEEKGAGVTVRHSQSDSRKPVSLAKAEKIGTLEGAGLVALGAMVGAGIRAGIGLVPLPKQDVPVGTLIVNLCGALLLGLLYSVLDRPELRAVARRDESGARARMVLRLLLGTGVMGGLTTYSTFVLEVDSRFGQGRIGLALAYGIGSILAGWLAVVLGDLLGRLIVHDTGSSAAHEEATAEEPDVMPVKDAQAAEPARPARSAERSAR